MTKDELKFVLENVSKTEEELQIEFDWYSDLLFDLEQQLESNEITQSDFEEAYTKHSHQMWIIEEIMKNSKKDLEYPIGFNHQKEIKIAKLK